MSRKSPGDVRNHAAKTSAPYSASRRKSNSLAASIQADFSFPQLWEALSLVATWEEIPVGELISLVTEAADGRDPIFALKVFLHEYGRQLATQVKAA